MGQLQVKMRKWMITLLQLIHRQIKVTLLICHCDTLAPYPQKETLQRDSAIASLIPRAGNLQSGVGKLLKGIALQEQEVQSSSAEGSDIPKKRPRQANRKRCTVGLRCLTGATAGSQRSRPHLRYNNGYSWETRPHRELGRLSHLQGPMRIPRLSNSKRKREGQR